MSEKTELPTSKKLRDAREKGQVAKSQEVCSAAVIITVMAVFILRFTPNLEQLQFLFNFTVSLINTPFREAATEAGSAALYTFFFVAAPFVAAAPLAGIAGHMGQVGVLFAVKGAMPSLEKLSPKQWVNKVFSKKALVELLKTIVKVLVLGLILQKVVLDSMDSILKSGMHSPQLFLASFGQVMMSVFLWTTLIFVAVAAVDFLLQRWLFTKQMMMSKDEVKREYKEMEGDPHIKSQRKSLHKEMVMNDTIQNTRKASVLVTNPTRVAVALYYQEDETPLPVISAMGEGAVAKKMRQIAEEEGIPIMQNIDLARGLLEQGETGNYIPSELIQPVAEVMRWVNELTGRR